MGLTQTRIEIAQDIINNCDRGRELKELFYPILAEQEQADYNITKCLRDLKNG